MKVLVLFAALVAAVTGQEQHIIGGTNVTEAGKWPFVGVVSIYPTYNDCGISLISQDWGLTAAFCVSYTPPEYMRFRFGSIFKTSGGKVYSAREVIVHEDYNDEGPYMKNDVALVRFNEPVSGENIASIPLAMNGSDHTGNDNSWFMGWGYDGTNQEGSEILQEANFTILSVEACSNLTRGDDTMVCAEGNGRTTCYFDEGGPMVCMVNGRYELVGIGVDDASHCNPHYVPLFTRISSFRDWIYDKTGI